MRRKQRWRRQNTVVGKNPESWVTNFCKYGLSSRSDRWRFCAQSGDACFRVSREDVLIFRLYSSSTPGDSKSTLCPFQMSWIVGPLTILYAQDRTCQHLNAYFQRAFVTGTTHLLGKTEVTLTSTLVLHDNSGRA